MGCDGAAFFILPKFLVVSILPKNNGGDVIVPLMLVLARAFIHSTRDDNLGGSLASSLDGTCVWKIVFIIRTVERFGLCYGSWFRSV